MNYFYKIVVDGMCYQREHFLGYCDMQEIYDEIKSIPNCHVQVFRWSLQSPYELFMDNMRFRRI